MSSITVNEPGSSHPSLANSPTPGEGFDRSWFMGKWGVAWSTLPMWKDKKNVVIEYVPNGDQPIHEKFDSNVYYIKQSQKEDTSPSSVRGTETLTPGTNGATFDWKGKSWLFFVHSHWEVLGYGKEDSGLDWAVTYFSKTLFTPAGLDIYIRTSPSRSIAGEVDTPTKQKLLEKIVGALQLVKPVEDLAKAGFEVPGVYILIRAMAPFRIWQG